ncbi:MAG: hypothetical protein JSV16_16390 [Candidatus Hydrogenedentota bacterium]|nr:MAG: hypothetical protein JSV16_16390 [Candidatus Hydrogenedentota bacterium]
MKDKYRISLIMPKGYTHSLCFKEIAELLKGSLNSVGFDCDMKINELADNRINIILGYHLLKFDEALLRYRYIPYQLEQLEAKGGWYSENVKRLLENAYEVWDYSEENIGLLNRLNIEAKHLPIGYHESLELIDHETEKDVDILFYGSIGERRRRVLDRLSDIANVKVLFGVYGEQRDAFISRARIILNIHYYSTEIFEAPRISYLLNNGCFVVSETSPNNPYEAVNLCLVPYDRIVETCMHYLKHPEEMEDMRRSGYADFKKNYPMIGFIRDVL